MSREQRTRGTGGQLTEDETDRWTDGQATEDEMDRSAMTPSEGRRQQLSLQLRGLNKCEELQQSSPGCPLIFPR